MTTFNNLDLNLLRVFHAIAEQRSLTLAGVSLNLSQPAVSYALGRLRQIFDDPLFIRTREGMLPTPAALELAKPISRALEAVREALRYSEGFEPLCSTRLFRAALTDAANTLLLLPISEALRVRAPLSRLHVELASHDDIEDALCNGRIDFAIGHLPALKTTLHHRLLFRDEYVCMTRKRATLPTGDSMTLETFCALEHLDVQSDRSSQMQMDSLLRALGQTRQATLHLPHFSLVPLVLMRSDLVAALPWRLARLMQNERRGQFKAYRLPWARIDLDFALYWHRDLDIDQAISWMRELIAELNAA